MDKFWDKEENFIGEEDFNFRMGEVRAWAEGMEQADISAADGTRLRCYGAVNPEEQAAVVFVHGFSEFFPKYHEMLWYFYRCGYSVFYFDQRGHGFSDRVSLDDEGKVYVRSFDSYVADLHCFIGQFVQPRSKSGRLFMMAHSMGGCVGTLYLEKYPETFVKAALSCPMHRMLFKGTPAWQIKLLTAAVAVLPIGKKYAPGQGPVRRDNWFKHGSAKSFARYQYAQDARLADPHYRTSGATYAWIRAAVKAMKQQERQQDRIKIPVLLFEAGKDKFVDNEGHRVFTANVPQTKIVPFPEAKHEIFNGTDEERLSFYRTLFGWLEE